MNPELSLQQTIDQIKDISTELLLSYTELENDLVWEEDFSSLTIDPTNIEEVFNFIRDQEIRKLQSPDKNEFQQLLELHKISSEF